jgi:transketolase C-terminal domain/subunit
VAEVKRERRDVTIVAYSKMLLVALEAAEQLRREDIEVEVIDPRTLKPSDLRRSRGRWSEQNGQRRPSVVVGIGEEDPWLVASSCPN